jgi:hypothetical protein
VYDAPGETWAAVSSALYLGTRGFKGGSSLGEFLAKHRNVPKGLRRPALIVSQILAWVDEHHARTGKWPNVKSGPVVGVPGETWVGVELALKRGSRGLPGGSSLHLLLVEQRGIRRTHRPARLTIEEILTWAKQHHRRTGTWPKQKSRKVSDSQEDTWEAIDVALRLGYRGLNGGSSLSRLLAEHGAKGVRGDRRHGTRRRTSS